MFSNPMSLGGIFEILQQEIDRRHNLEFGGLSVVDLIYSCLKYIKLDACQQNPGPIQ